MYQKGSRLIRTPVVERPSANLDDVNTPPTPSLGSASRQIVAAKRPPFPELGTAKSHVRAIVAGSASVLTGDAAADSILALQHLAAGPRQRISMLFALVASLAFILHGMNAKATWVDSKGQSLTSSQHWTRLPLSLAATND